MTRDQHADDDAAIIEKNGAADALDTEQGSRQDGRRPFPRDRIHLSQIGRVLETSWSTRRARGHDKMRTIEDEHSRKLASWATQVETSRQRLLDVCCSMLVQLLLPTTYCWQPGTVPKDTIQHLVIIEHTGQVICGSPTFHQIGCTVSS